MRWLLLYKGVAAPYTARNDRMCRSAASTRCCDTRNSIYPEWWWCHDGRQQGCVRSWDMHADCPGTIGSMCLTTTTPPRCMHVPVTHTYAATQCIASVPFASCHRKHVQKHTQYTSPKRMMHIGELGGCMPQDNRKQTSGPGWDRAWP